MQIKICKTYDFSNKEWLSYITSFNNVFNLNRDLNYFKKKYKSEADGYSLHALLLNDNLDVVGGCTIIPVFYNRNNNIIKIGQTVDVFILEKYRTDPLMLKRMYSKLKNLLIENNLVAVLAVPNEISFSYWINIVKWEVVGDLTYWAIPIKLSSIIKKPKIYNVISVIYLKVLLPLNSIFSFIYNKSQRRSNYELVESDNFLNYRFNNNYQKIKKNNITFYFRLYNENNIKTAYLFHAKENNKLTFRSLLTATKYIIKNTDSKLILFIGQIKLFQFLYFKVPKRYQPKRLPLTCDILDKNNKDLYSDMYKLDSWDFGLKNYDVR